MKIKFKEAMFEYLKYKKYTLKKSTYLTNIRKINKYILPYFENNDINISFNDYLNWQYTINDFNFKYNYKSSIHYIFSDFFEFCINNYDLKNNIAKKVGNFRNNEISDIGNIWTLEEYNKFIDSIDDIVYKTLFELLFFTGVRKSEALGLTWNDINFKFQYIFINKQISRYIENGKKVFITPKTKKSVRKIAIDKYLLNNLKELYKYYKKNYVNFDNKWFVFGGIKSISETQLKRKKDYYCEQSNIKKITIHGMRHSHACILFQNGVPIEDISSRLGHSNISMTMNVYLKYLPKDEKRVINTLNSIRLN